MARVVENDMKKMGITWKIIFTETCMDHAASEKEKSTFDVMNKV
jgi:hypothetical protein